MTSINTINTIFCGMIGNIISAYIIRYIDKRIQK